jgi:hypothetical protein
MKAPRRLIRSNFEGPNLCRVIAKTFERRGPTRPAPAASDARIRF